MLRLGTYLPLLSFALLLSCGKSLPKPTQEGKNTFGCKIDGRNWVPTGLPGAPGGGSSPPVVGGYQSSLIPNTPKWNVWIRAYREHEGVFIWLNHVVKPGRYDLKTTTETKPNALYPPNYGSYEPSRDAEFATTAQYTGYVQVIKADTVNYIVSGTFEFTAVNRRDPSKTIGVTKGRFDVCTGMNCK